MALGQNSYNMPSATSGSQYVSKMKHTPIAPAPMTKSVLGMNGSNVQSSESLVQKTKYAYANMTYGEQPASVIRRNARERNRVKQVNNGFVNLRQHIPQSVVAALSNGGRGASKKLSKVDTLRIAVEYIRSMKDMIEEADSCSESGSNSSFSSMGSTAGSPPPATYYTSNEQYLMPATYSATASSPAPSFASENSNSSSHNFMHSTPIQPMQPQFKYESYENYNHFQSGSDDEELLDYISLWQEQ